MEKVRMEIRLKLMRNSLTQTWLINRLYEIGVRTDKTELSSALAGRRKGPKVEKVLKEGLKILEDYEQKMGVAS